MAPQNPLTEVEEEIKQVKEEIKQVKEEIKQLKEGRSKDEYVSDVEYTRAQDGLAQWLVILTELLKEENLLRSQEVGGGGGNSADMEEVVLRALKRAKDSENISISAITSTNWQLITRPAGITVVPCEPPLAAGASSGSSCSTKEFKWDDRPEGSQVDRYMPHLKELFRSPGQRSSKLVWLECGSKEKDLLTVTGSNMLPYNKISGNTDVAIVTRASVEMEVPKCGLCLLFELKKQTSPSDMYQANCQLLLANMLSVFHPVVILTDLAKNWTLLWLSGDKVYMQKFASSAAIATVTALIDQAEVFAASPTNTVASFEGLPDSIAGRSALTVKSQIGSAVVAGGMDAGIEDLSGFLSDAELQEARAAMLMQRMAPWLHTLCQSDALPPPIQMFS